MAHYLISYDLDLSSYTSDSKKSARYATVEKEIKKKIDKNADKVLFSQWIVQSPKPLDTLFLDLKSGIFKSDDRFLVCQISANIALGRNLRESKRSITQTILKNAFKLHRAF